MAVIERANMGTTLGSGRLWWSWWWWCPSSFHQSQSGSAEANAVETRITARSIIKRFIDLPYLTPSAVLVKTECVLQYCAAPCTCHALDKRFFLATLDSCGEVLATLHQLLTGQVSDRFSLFFSSAEQPDYCQNHGHANREEHNSSPLM